MSNTANRTPINYPYPDTKSGRPDLTPHQFDDACLVWRRSLTDMECRSFAVDYRMGKDCDISYDGFLEYMHRGLDKKLAPAPKGSKKTRRKRKA